ncbi:hypothetical protein CVT26_004123 [Gymnopilus dilepis]|uniref:Uncharacterized protein n=1 Tax=Gymnopilus dilepis TaxID=231916 RepID=A0A409WTR0_9AGAR|nr:hypothetical protein CVT26_004123 [Gymnopilus dilepis]
MPLSTSARTPKSFTSSTSGLRLGLGRSGTSSQLGQNVSISDDISPTDKASLKAGLPEVDRADKGKVVGSMGSNTLAVNVLVEHIVSVDHGLRMSLLSGADS